jgi:hypothetical protein
MKIGQAVLVLVADFGNSDFGPLRGLDVLRGSVVSFDDSDAVIKMPGWFGDRLETHCRSRIFTTEDAIFRRVLDGVK